MEEDKIPLPRHPSGLPHVSCWSRHIPYSCLIRDRQGEWDHFERFGLMPCPSGGRGGVPSDSPSRESGATRVDRPLDLLQQTPVCLGSSQTISVCGRSCRSESFLSIVGPSLTLAETFSELPCHLRPVLPDPPCSHQHCQTSPASSCPFLFPFPDIFPNKSLACLVLS